METRSSPGESQSQDGCETYQAKPEQPFSEAVIEAVAAATDMDALDLADEFGPLYDAINPSALDSLFQSTAEATPAAGSVTFVYAGYQITVDQTGWIVLTDQQ